MDPRPPFSEDLYRELRAQAARHMGREGAGHTLQPTALLHEAYLRLAARLPQDLASGTAFLAAAATTFRRILIDHARRRRALKRSPGPGQRLDIATPGLEPPATPRDTPPDPHGVDVLELDEALNHLARIDLRAARVVELRFFGGLSHPRIASLLAVSLSTVEDDWRFARAWLANRLGA